MLGQLTLQLLFYHGSVLGVMEKRRHNPFGEVSHATPESRYSLEESGNSGIVIDNLGGTSQALDA